MFYKIEKVVTNTSKQKLPFPSAALQYILTQVSFYTYRKLELHQSKPNNFKGKYTELELVVLLFIIVQGRLNTREP